MRMKVMFFSLMVGLLGACTHVDAGHVGVVVHQCGGGGVDDTPVGVGYNATGPCTDIIEFPVYQQTMVLTRNQHEGVTDNDKVDDGSITVTSSEGLPIIVDSSLSFTIQDAMAPKIYKRFRQPIEEIQHKYLRQIIREKLQQTFAKYTAQQLYSDKKEFARAEVELALANALKVDGFLVSQFTINGTEVPAQVSDAIKQKVAAVQLAQQAEQAVRRTKAEADQKVAAAQGDADSMRLKADAEAYANEKITKSLSPALVQYRLAGKWNGVLSQYTGSGANFLFGSK